MNGNELMKGENKRRVFWEEGILERALGQELNLGNWKKDSAPGVQGRSV